MEWLSLILTTLGGGILALVGSMLYFRPKLKQAQAEAAIKETEAETGRYEALVKRLNSMEEMYGEQGRQMDELRKEILRLSDEKFSNEKRIIQLEGENKTLSEKVARLEKELEAYKFIKQDIVKR